MVIRFQNNLLNIKIDQDVAKQTEVYVLLRAEKQRKKEFGADFFLLKAQKFEKRYKIKLF